MVDDASDLKNHSTCIAGKPCSYKSAPFVAPVVFCRALA
jgi:hypothetical protein